MNWELLKEEAAEAAEAGASAPPQPIPLATRMHKPEHEAHGFHHLYGTSPAMKRLYRMIRKVAPTEAGVLVIGESGTGKELVASTIHAYSARNTGRFVAINCGALSPSLIEAELFGHERGSFTGAVRSHKGCFERASGGTLFLDEISEMPLELQVKLLRALETRKFYRVGGDQEIAVDVRVIASTNRDPHAAVAAGTLREDLLYRLAVFPIKVPPLRARAEDVRLLAQHFLDELNEAGGTHKRFSEQALEALAMQRWPGNVRELKNVVQRAYILADDELTFEPSDDTVMVAEGPLRGGPMLQFAIGMPLDEIERQVIMATLEHCHGHKKQTARLLGVSLKTLYNRLNEYHGRQARTTSSCLSLVKCAT